MSHRQDILLVGAGIAGCAAAIALAERGHHVRLIERESVWAFASSGIFLYSNALQSLEHLGVLPAVLSAGFVIPQGRNVYLDHTGRELAVTHYPTARDGAIPAIAGIKRAELHRVLADRLGDLGVVTQLGTTISTLNEVGEKVRVTLSDGTMNEFDLVVGCEGVRSPLRQRVAPGNQPRYSGFGIWRSVHRRPPDLVDKIMMMGVGTRLGIMPISDDRLYLFGTVHDPAKRRHEPATWPERMAAAFAEYADPARQFLDELGPESEVLYTAVEEVDLPPPWHRGRVLVIGDAAHASTPFMGQGGAMALEDAVVLARLLDQSDEVDAVCQAFTALRHPVCTFARDESRKVGEAGAEEDAETCRIRNERFGQTAQASVDRFYAELHRLGGAR
ncbi:FAD-dependent oxidoreductase [Enemella sp. A6]|uniref:FAD-dependent oxidoreductase n=1 Tax=Enemella sp. A6 TaxID=3440152 RepID=UPI003EBA678E